jgi:lipid II:glycine glycyltransferase (peptidoglycan interpeptide bridge formation enzyme)
MPGATADAASSDATERDEDRSPVFAVNRSPLDPEWDDFVSQTSGGHHLQTSRWAQVKATVGWRAARVVARRDGRIVGGCQVLMRPLPLIGSLAYVPRGPLTADAGQSTLDAILTGIREVARRERVLYLKIQPPVDRRDMEALLLARGFRPSGLEATPTATVRVDLRCTPEELLAQMSKNRRRNIRRAEGSGVNVRSGGAEDLPAYYRTIQATADRQGFLPYPARYYEQLWRSFSPGGHAMLLLAESGQRVVASLLLIAFRDTVLFKMGGWTGEHREARVNELLHWRAILLARSRGFRWYDLEGIAPDVAVAIRERHPRTPHTYAGTTRFKLGFGGSVALFPPAFDAPCTRGIGRGVMWLSPRAARWHTLIWWMVGRRG